MLHSEILSLSHFAAENTDGRSGPDDSTIIESQQDSESNELMHAADGNDAPNVIWYDEPTPASEVPAQQDDSDLIWITEDVDVEKKVESGIQEPTRIDRPSTPEPSQLNVDYRELLEKMRSHS